MAQIRRTPKASQITISSNNNDTPDEHPSFFDVGDRLTIANLDRLDNKTILIANITKSDQNVTTLVRYKADSNRCDFSIEAVDKDSYRSIHGFISRHIGSFAISLPLKVLEIPERKGFLVADSNGREGWYAYRCEIDIEAIETMPAFYMFEINAKAVLINNCRSMNAEIVNIYIPELILTRYQLPQVRI